MALTPEKIKKLLPEADADFLAAVLKRAEEMESPKPEPKAFFADRENPMNTREKPAKEDPRQKIMTNFAQMKNEDYSSMASPEEEPKRAVEESDKQAVLDFIESTKADSERVPFPEDSAFLSPEVKYQGEGVPPLGVDPKYDEAMDRAFGSGKEATEKFLTTGEAPARKTEETENIPKAIPVKETTEEVIPKAKVIIDDSEVDKLFKVTHGTSFDPKSKMDQKKRQEIETLLIDKGGLGKMSPNQFALQVYRKFNYV